MLDFLVVRVAGIVTALQQPQSETSFHNAIKTVGPAARISRAAETIARLHAEAQLRALALLLALSPGRVSMSNAGAIANRTLRRAHALSSDQCKKGRPAGGPFVSMTLTAFTSRRA